MNKDRKIKVGIIFGNFGPYHHARTKAFQNYCKNRNFEIIPIEISQYSSTYRWKSKFNFCKNLISLFDLEEEKINPILIFTKTFLVLREKNIRVAFLPSYSPLRYFVLLLAAKANFCKTVMMNESHKGTEKAKGLTKHLKKFLVNQFDSALVGGSLHKEYFHSLGLPESKIFTGYDAIDNDYFIESAKNIRKNINKLNNKYNKNYLLPDSYFLSLGRLVYKKNLIRLIKAYSAFSINHFKKVKEIPTALVIVGEGTEKDNIIDLIYKLNLNFFDLSKNNPKKEFNKKINHNSGSVYFYGFKQIEENPIFFSFAKAFILPSIYEEWGLVVNEAMACSVPIIASEVAGCVEDLMPKITLKNKNDKKLFREYFRNNLSENIRKKDLPKLKKNGLTFNPYSEESLQIALEYIEATSRENKIQYFKMCDSSLKIIKNFSCQNFAKQAYKALISAL